MNECFNGDGKHPKQEPNKKEEWNENIKTCSGCGIHWKKIGQQCPVCYAPAEKHEPKQEPTSENWKSNLNALLWRFRFLLETQKKIDTQKFCEELEQFISNLIDKEREKAYEHERKRRKQEKINCADEGFKSGVISERQRIIEIVDKLENEDNLWAIRDEINKLS